jgi:hypothetical protein
MADRQGGGKLGESSEPENRTPHTGNATTNTERDEDVNTSDTSGDRSGKGTGTRSAPDQTRGGK